MIHRFGRRFLEMLNSPRSRWSAFLVVLFGCEIFAIQLLGGSFTAEFTAHPDEPGQFISGLMVYDYVRQLPSGDPLDWALNYYLHYPRVAIGRWPPGFAVTEALWWLVFGASRWSALALLGVITWISAIIFHRLASRIAPPALAVFGTSCLIASPVVAESVSAVMADAPGLLVSVLIIDATARWIVCPRKSTVVWIVCILFFGLMTKGTALCLVPAPLLAISFVGKARRLWPGMAIALGVAAGAAGLFYLFSPAAFRYLAVGLAGLRSDIPWSGILVFSLAGLVFCLLAAVGFYFTFSRRNPIAVAAAATVVSTIAVSFLMRAMQEPRHWIVILPGILLLALHTISAVAGNSNSKLALASLFALTSFPFHINHQDPVGYGAFIDKIHLPSRIMISSAEGGEGPLIVAIALKDRRVTSLVVRATKVLASEDWNGEDYHLLVADPQQVELRLDELRIDTVLLHTFPGTPAAPHHLLLRKTLASSGSWKQSVGGGIFEAWRRVRTPTVPAKPLEIDLRNRIGRIAREGM
jgi:hypothetical protein